MYKRLCNPLKSNSFFLFGARGTGKSSLLRHMLSSEGCLWIDLLSPEEEAFYQDAPGRLSEQISSFPGTLNWVVIDEVQRAPKLLDVVHSEIEKRGVKFALTGSSARKLKAGGANLLAGRAFVNHLYPLTFLELEDDFDLLAALTWGTLPKIFSLKSSEERTEFLKAYVNTYLKEEVFQEQLVRQTVPFRKFLQIAAQMNGKILNLNGIAKDLGVDWSTVKTYFDILEDTWLGFSLPAFERSLRKQQLKASKFYLFDVGVQRVLDRTITLKPSTSQMIGPLFEHFIVSELYRLNQYFRKDYAFSYLATQGGLEVDVVVERPGQKSVLVEIKSSDSIRDDHVRNLQSLVAEFPAFEAMCICQESRPRTLKGVQVVPWRAAFESLGLTSGGITFKN